MNEQTQSKRTHVYEIKVVAPVTEVSADFLQGMANRMAVSYFKYGPLDVAYPIGISAMESLRQRLDAYVESGNTEFLIDAANFAMIEFMHPSHRDAHFSPTDSDASPGRVTQDGRVTVARNSEVTRRAS